MTQIATTEATWQSTHFETGSSDDAVVARVLREGFFKQPRSVRGQYGKLMWRHMPGLSKAAFVSGCLAGVMPFMILVTLPLSFMVLARARRPVEAEAYLDKEDYRVGRGLVMLFAVLYGALVVGVAILFLSLALTDLVQ